MGIKNMFKKSSKLFEKEGFYIVLFVCLCIVAVTAVYISRNNANLAKKSADNQKKIEQKQPSAHDDGVSLVDENNNDKSVPTMQQPSKNQKASSTSTNQSSKTSGQTSTKTSTITGSNNFKLEMPVAGQITKHYDNYNPQYSETLQLWETHEAIDIACDLGTEVKAAQAGKVTKVTTDDVIAGNKSGFGVSIEIDHGNGFKTVYSNLSEEGIKVKAGQKVKAGEVIGVVGDTSVSELVSVEGSHLHFEVLKKVKDKYVTVNPEDYLKIKK